MGGDWVYRLSQQPLCQSRVEIFQENAQSSLNIAQKLPAIIDESHAKNFTPDAILLDNTITDAHFWEDQRWFEAVVRALVQSFPGTVIVSLVVDAIPSLVDSTGNHEKAFLGWLHQVQRHYGLTVINIAKMVRLLHSTHTKDLLWPQSTNMISSNGTELSDLVSDEQGLDPVYWANFLPKVQKI
mmetsp:Transcript_41363/g.74565  ORF Transcript_41363/g.74565 Transcript_41363/m.74565 type:complete len:184 (+) Transcript_41363:723-1274(+)